jgi:hypothetical protein
MGDEDYNAWLDGHRDELERLSPAPLGDFGAEEEARRRELGLIWRAEGGKSDDVDWELRGREIAEVTAALRSVLADFPVAGDASREAWWYRRALEELTRGLSFDVAGVGHVPDYPDNLLGLAEVLNQIEDSEGVGVVLRREPDNVHDRNAIAVYVPSGGTDFVGYVPRRLAETLAPILDAGREFICSVVEVSSGPGLRVSVRSGSSDLAGGKVDEEDEIAALLALIHENKLAEESEVWEDDPAAFLASLHSVYPGESAD